MHDLEHIPSINRMMMPKPNYVQTDKIGRFIPNLKRQLIKAARNDAKRHGEGRWYSGRTTNA